MRPILSLVRLPHSHIDPDWRSGVEACLLKNYHPIPHNGVSTLSSTSIERHGARRKRPKRDPIVSSLPLAPAQFAAQRLEESALFHAHEVHCVLRTVAANLVAHAEVHGLLAIHCQQAVARHAFDAHGQ
jgi:hypothetical protein